MDYKYRFPRSSSWSKFSNQEKFDHILHMINMGKSQFKDHKANVYLGAKVAKFIKQYHAKHHAKMFCPAYWTNVDEDIPGNCVVVRSGVVAVIIY